MLKIKTSAKRRAELLYVAFLLGVPIIHFLIFNLYINLDAILLTFKTYKSNTNQYVWNVEDIFLNYKDMFKLFTAESNGFRNAKRCGS